MAGKVPYSFYPMEPFALLVICSSPQWNRRGEQKEGKGLLMPQGLGKVEMWFYLHSDCQPHP